MSLTIKEIESLNEIEFGEKFGPATVYDAWEIKGHWVHVIELGEPWGLSAIVFYEGQQISYANDYQMHHPHKSKQELADWYYKSMHNKLFTEEELLAPLTDYTEYQRRLYYLMNYYAQRRPHVSAFYVREEDKPETSGLILCPAAMSYYHAEDKEFVHHYMELFYKLADLKDAPKPYEYWVSAFYYEMCNHEYGINWQGDWDVLRCFADGDLPYRDEDGKKGREFYFECLHFTDEQKRAYAEARKRYYKEAEEKGWY